MRAIIFVNGVIDEYDWLKQLIQDDDVLICADGGTKHCLACDRTPHLVVGDMDSLDAELIERLTQKGVAFRRFPVAKNETDLELAIDAALEAQENGATADEILLVGALGGRLDQTLANILILAQRAWPIPLRIVDANESAQVICGAAKIVVHGQVGDIFSAIPLSESVTGITYTGMLYPLDNATLSLGSTRGISNEFAAEEATVSIRSGRLLLVHRTVQR